MKRLDLQPRQIDREAYLFHRPKEQDYDTLIDESAQVFVDGKIVAHYEVLDEVPLDLLWAFRKIQYNKSYRTEGLLTQSRVFGSQPRVTIRRDFCTQAGLAVQEPRAHEVFLQWAQRADRIYRDVAPELYVQHAQMAATVKPCWRINDTVFTSGIANKDNALFYHHDAGNFKGTWNAMYALSLDCDGGHTVVPELGLAFSFARPAFIIFEAQRLVHGVTELRKLSQQACRYSVVFYTLQQMCKCGTLDEELERIRRVKTGREHKRGKK